MNPLILLNKPTVLTIVSSLFFFFLVGCSKGPEKNVLQKRIEKKLSQYSSDNLFQVTGFSRRGSYEYTEGKDKKLLIYFKLHLKLLKDYKFSQWNGPNQNSLISLLGATSSGVVGINPNGNKRDDLLTVYGVDRYLWDSSQKNWISAHYKLPTEVQKVVEAPDKKVKERPAKGKFVSELEEDDKYHFRNLPIYKQHVHHIEEMAKEFLGDNDVANLQELERELRNLLQKIRLKLAMDKKWVTVATGPQDGIYDLLGQSLEKTLTQKKNVVKAFTTSGSVHNLDLMRNKQVHFAMVQSDTAFMAYKGKGFFHNKGPFKNLRALNTLFPETIHIITRQSFSGKQLKDLKGRRISIGEKDSGSSVNALQVIKASGMNASDFQEVLQLGAQKAMKFLLNKKIDAFIMTSAYPAQIIKKLPQENPVKMLALDQKTIQKLVEQYSYISLEIPPQTYDGQKKSVPTVGVTAMLVTHKDIPKKMVKKYLGDLYQNVTRLSKDSWHASLISKGNGQRNIKIPLHEGAKEYFSQDSK